MTRTFALLVSLLGLPGLAWAQQPTIDQIRASAERGDAKAQFLLGKRYSNGDGVPKDWVQAVSWCRKAANSGYATAQLEMGLLYSEGVGVRHDDEQAERWLQKAVAQDDLDAYVALGWFYINADRPKRDRERGAALYLVAAERGNVAAMYSVAEQYELGRGVLTNESHDEAAVRWFLKVADHGDSQAMRVLADHYEDGRGVLRNYIEAYKWWSIAAARAPASDRKQYLRIPAMVITRSGHRDRPFRAS